MMKRTRSIEGETIISYITNFSNLRGMKNSLLLNIGQQWNKKIYLLIVLKFCLTPAKTSIQGFFVFSEVFDIQDLPSDDACRLPTLFILKSRILECKLFLSSIFAHEVMVKPKNTTRKNFNIFALFILYSLVLIFSHWR